MRCPGNETKATWNDFVRDVNYRCGRTRSEELRNSSAYRQRSKRQTRSVERSILRFTRCSLLLGLWDSVEECGPEDWRDSGAEEDL